MFGSGTTFLNSSYLHVFLPELSSSAVHTRILGSTAILNNLACIDFCCQYICYCFLSQFDLIKKEVESKLQTHVAHEIVRFKGCLHTTHLRIHSLLINEAILINKGELRSFYAHVKSLVPFSDSLLMDIWHPSQLRTMRNLGNNADTLRIERTL